MHNTQDVLKDPWVVRHMTADSDNLNDGEIDFGEKYIRRIKSLRIKMRLKKVVHGVITTIRMRKILMQSKLKLLTRTRSVCEGVDLDVDHLPSLGKEGKGQCQGREEDSSSSVPASPAIEKTSQSHFQF